MAWKFDFAAVDLVWTQPAETMEATSSIILGEESSDLQIDTGDRNNDTSIIDQGYRIIDGDI